MPSLDFAEDIKFGKSVAEEIRRNAQVKAFIAGRGFLCHELLYLLGGRIEFIITPWWNIIRHACDAILGLFPLCRWYPPEGTILEYIGYASMFETKFYRCVTPGKNTVVFAIEFDPGSDSFFPFRGPRLKEDLFLRPPFENDRNIIKDTLRGISIPLPTYTPLASEETIINIYKHNLEQNRGIWEGLCKK
jgi:hypothetical protein